MNNPASVVWPRLPISRLRNAQAALLTLALHALVLALLLANWPVEKPPAPSINTISMQLLSLPPPAPVVEVPPPEGRAPVEPQVVPRIAQRRLEQAALRPSRGGRKG